MSKKRQKVLVKSYLFAYFHSANLITLSFGWNCGFANANFLELQVTDKLRDGPLTFDEASMFVSLICVGALLGNIIYLWIIEKFGRKKPMLFLAIPIFVCTLFIGNIEKHFFFHQSNSIVDKLVSCYFCKECLLVVCISYDMWICWWCIVYRLSDFRERNLFR